MPENFNQEVFKSHSEQMMIDAKDKIENALKRLTNKEEEVLIGNQDISR